MPFQDILGTAVSGLNKLVKQYSVYNAVVTPLRKAASYEPRLAVLGI